jgi:hypothetical protein
MPKYKVKEVDPGLWQVLICPSWWDKLWGAKTEQALVTFTQDCFFQVMPGGALTDVAEACDIRMIKAVQSHYIKHFSAKVQERTLKKLEVG